MHSTRAEGAGGDRERASADRTTGREDGAAADPAGRRGARRAGRAVGAGVVVAGGVASAVASAVIGGGCRSSPFAEESERALARSIDDAASRELAGSVASDRRMTEREAGLDRLGIEPRFLAEIAAGYDPAAYEAALAAAAGGDAGAGLAGLLGEDLLGRPHRVVPMDLATAVSMGVSKNLDVQVATFGPAIAQASVVAAEAAFDWNLFSGVEWQDVDEESLTIGGGQFRSASQTISSNLGLTRRLQTGASITVREDYTYNDPRPISGGFGGDAFSHRFGTTVAFEQPLLDGFGREVNRSEIRLAQNAERREVAQLRAQLIGTATAIERAYWELVRARRNLVIAQKLLERGEVVREQVRARLVNEATQAQVADAVATVERRRGDVLTARTALRRASDALKQLVNHPELPVGGEELVLPTDAAFDEPVEYGLFDSLETALSQRPEIDLAVLAIDDASIRQVVADNGRRPELNFAAEASANSSDRDAGSAFSGQNDGEFVDGFLFGLRLNQALGNRADEAGYRRARLERMRAVVEYRRTVQAVALELKNALDGVVLNYRLIDQARVSRIATAEALRTLEVEKTLVRDGFSVTRLNLELSQQEALAAAERAEIGAVVEYNIALADLSAATGTSLERNRIDFVVPEAADVPRDDRGAAYDLPGRDE